MTEEEIKEVKAQLATIKPGENYPTNVTITETADGKTVKVKFLLQSYFVGMYCAIYVGDGGMPHQTGDHNNKTLVTKLKKDISKALKRGATVEIGSLAPVKTEMSA